MKLTPEMRAAAKLFGEMGGKAARNQREAGKASQTPEVKARRAATRKANGKASRRSVKLRTGKRLDAQRAVAYCLRVTATNQHAKP